MSNDTENIKNILKLSLSIVDELADVNIDDLNGNSDDYAKLEKLVKRAKILKRNKNWKL